jgi:hypothetical protein
VQVVEEKISTSDVNVSAKKKILDINKTFFGGEAVNYSQIFAFCRGSSNITSAKARDECIFGVELEFYQFLNLALYGCDRLTLRSEILSVLPSN